MPISSRDSKPDPAPNRAHVRHIQAGVGAAGLAPRDVQQLLQALHLQRRSIAPQASERTHGKVQLSPRLQLPPFETLPFTTIFTSPERVVFSLCRCLRCSVSDRIWSCSTQNPPCGL